MRIAVLVTSSFVLAGCAAHAAPSHLGGAHASPPSDVEHARYRGTAAPYVTAESRYGHGTVSGPVRQGPRGTLEVRMPGGTWITCARACSETLRRETVDFWESRGGRDNPVDGPAYLNWRW
jgi:hypothetical protein